ncbi:MAG: thioredoxin family protein [Acholeplasmataceae bacterium]|nr:thioredoxin family protein [Acholeplasmataceae bacterium]
MQIKVLGTGCKKCHALFDNVKEAIKESPEFEVIEVTDVMAIANAGVLRTPALVVGSKVLSSGRVPDVDEIKTMLKQI